MGGQDQKTMYSYKSLYTTIIKELKFQSFKYWLDKLKVLQALELLSVKYLIVHRANS